ncbi:hypothetical protein Golob_002013 [Gossypium lobatum]|uniref:Replication factor C subunit 1 n=1 Tax=Gossypium lobatum TaxID=34289 RepID=A0A7J8N467_9ROSI|nr:hypothetical protein [Gossypium lobatum]
MEGIPPAVKAALTKAYKEGSKTRIIRAADLVTLPGMKKAPKKRIAAILEPSDDVLGEENGDELPENDENTSDTEDLEGTTNGEKLQAELQSLNSKGIEVQMELKGTGNSSAKKAPSGRAKGGGRAASAEKKGGRGSGAVVCPLDGDDATAIASEVFDVGSVLEENTFPISMGFVAKLF